ncbi:cation-translocating P-type ATPase [Candidatus Thorarchaeota archaeon]|nr:MAG: cation-translocating P-type ATPase [Candidatus Thorarchaeota archaeon]
MVAEKVPIESPWSRPVEEILDTLDVDPERGLSEEEVARRLDKYGKNRLREVAKRSIWDILVEQFKSLMVAILFLASVLALIFGDPVEALAIGAVIIINATVGFVTELRAVRSMESLQELGGVSANVRRAGNIQEIDGEDIVPGDVVLIEGGDVLTADLRLVETSKLQLNEAALTGESVPVGKDTEPVDADAPVSERTSMVFKGTAVTRGSGTGVVVRTGMQTEIGTISSLVQQAEEEVTPLERRLNDLGRKLVWVTLLLGMVVTIFGIIGGKEVLLMIETGVALAVATVPEGLPLVATLGLARGMWRMARRNAIVKRLSAVETLGTTSVICTDKTGTLTESRMTVTDLVLSYGHVEVTGTGMDLEGEFHVDREPINPREDTLVRTLLEIGIFANRASTELEDIEEDDQSVGDPLEIAILVAGRKAGIKPDTLFQESPQIKKRAFDPELNMMASYNREEETVRISVKGAPEAVLESSSRTLTRDGTVDLDEKTREMWKERNRQLAGDGLRVIGFAQKLVEDQEAEAYSDLTFVGLAGLLDPSREDVEEAILACKNAGIRVVMVTGDHPVTAEKIAGEVGLIGQNGFRVITGEELENPDEMSEEEREKALEATVTARVSPKQKLDLIELHQKQNRIVAMTGDGVNDAPALKKADIGVAMGKRGTQVAQEAADIVLRNDKFSTIVYAVEEGRVIFNNIRKFVLYLLSCNMSEILVIALFSLLPIPLPIHPLQILFLNLVTDVFPALALGVGEGDASVMNRDPRPADEPIIKRGHWLSIGGYGTIITITVLSSFDLSSRILGLSAPVAGSVVFLTLAFAQLWHVFNMRVSDSGLVKNEVTTNPYVWVALVICIPLLIVPPYVPGFSGLLSLVDPGWTGWGLIFLMSIVPLAIGQLWKASEKYHPESWRLQ